MATLKQKLFHAAVEALVAQGWSVLDAPGGGSVKRITNGQQSYLVSIRTTQDQWIAFPRNSDDMTWVTLENVDYVVAASVDDPADPKIANIHIMKAEVVKAHFDACYAARKAAGHKMPFRRGIWISLYKQEDSNNPRLVGAGLGLKFPASYTYVLANYDAVPDLPKEMQTLSDDVEGDKGGEADEQPLTIADAKRRLALSLGVPESAIRILVEA